MHVADCEVKVDIRFAEIVKHRAFHTISNFIKYPLRPEISPPYISVDAADVFVNRLRKIRYMPEHMSIAVERVRVPNFNSRTVGTNPCDLLEHMRQPIRFNVLKAVR